MRISKRLYRKCCSKPQFHQQGRFDQAEQRYEAILTAHPNHFEAKHLFRTLRYQQGRYAEALDLLSAALRLNPNTAAALSHLGSVLTKFGRPEEALASCDKALAIKPDYREATVVNDWAVRQALESAGVDFIDENGGGPGVRLWQRARSKARKS